VKILDFVDYYGARLVLGLVVEQLKAESWSEQHASWACEMASLWQAGCQCRRGYRISPMLAVVDVVS